MSVLEHLIAIADLLGKDALKKVLNVMIHVLRIAGRKAFNFLFLIGV
jgi:hypothetical protein